MKPKDLFYPFLKRTALFSWILKLINIPVTVFIARLTSNVVSKATDSDIAAVVTAGLTLLSLVLSYRIFATLSETAYEKQLSKAQQKCKLALYRQFLKNPLNLLYQADQGDAMDPPLLLLDEPTNYLDAESKEVLLELLHHRSGCTLLISHEELFDAAADCIYTIEKGGLNLETANA